MVTIGVAVKAALLAMDGLGFAITIADSFLSDGIVKQTCNVAVDFLVKALQTLGITEITPENVPQLLETARQLEAEWNQKLAMGYKFDDSSVTPELIETARQMEQEWNQRVANGEQFPGQ